MYDVGDCFSGDSDFGYVRSISSNSEFQVKTEKVESVADMSNACLFHREFHTALLRQEYSNPVTQPLGMLLRASRDEHTPIICITDEPHIGASRLPGITLFVAVTALGMQEPVQLVEDHV